MGTVIRRRLPAHQLGRRPVARSFYFVRADGDKYPSESETICHDFVPEDPNAQTSWAWALGKVEVEDLWLVIPISQDGDFDAIRKDTDSVRASIWRTGSRRGLKVVTHYLAPNLYVKVVDK